MLHTTAGGDNFALRHKGIIRISSNECTYVHLAMTSVLSFCDSGETAKALVTFGIGERIGYLVNPLAIAACVG